MEQGTGEGEEAGGAGLQPRSVFCSSAKLGVRRRQLERSSRSPTRRGREAKPLACRDIGVGKSSRSSLCWLTHGPMSRVPLGSPRARRVAARRRPPTYGEDPWRLGKAGHGTGRSRARPTPACCRQHPSRPTLGPSPPSSTPLVAIRPLVTSRPTVGPAAGTDVRGGFVATGEGGHDAPEPTRPHRRRTRRPER